MSQATLRPAAPEDDPFLYQLYSSVREDEITAWGWPPDQADAFLRMQWAAQRSSYALHYPNAVQSIIEQADVPVGRIYADYADAYIRLVDISVLSAYRNCGIGSGVLRELQQEASRRQVPVLLSVAHGNPARRLYERLGFESEGATDMHLAMRWSPSHNIPIGEEQTDE